MRNLDQNGVRNVAPVNCGLSDTEAELALGIPSKRQHPAYDRRPDSGLFSVYANPSDAAPRARFTTMDTFCMGQGIGHLDFVKIDVEGHELSVLAGGYRTLTTSRRVCQVECNAASLAIARRRPEELVALLESYGYATFVFDGVRFAACTAALRATWEPHAVWELFAIPRGPTLSRFESEMKMDQPAR